MDGDVARVVADFTPLVASEESIKMAPGGGAWRAIHEGQIVHHHDMLAEGSENGRRIAARDGWRTTLMVPLPGEGEWPGYITLRRSEVRPFIEAEIELLQGFAAQATTALQKVSPPAP